MKRRDPFDRLLAQIVYSPDGCWLWTGFLIRGYGQFWLDGGKAMAHRASFVLHGGHIPDGWEIDHLCRVRNCVNPAHLEPVTRTENRRRTVPYRRDVRPTMAAVNAAKTECVNGHEFTERNTYIRPNGFRDCRVCIAQRARKYQLRKAAA